MFVQTPICPPIHIIMEKGSDKATVMNRSRGISYSHAILITNLSFKFESEKKNHHPYFM
jgi:hypothetical protein